MPMIGRIRTRIAPWYQ